MLESVSRRAEKILPMRHRRKAAHTSPALGRVSSSSSARVADKQSNDPPSSPPPLSLPLRIDEGNRAGGLPPRQRIAAVDGEEGDQLAGGGTRRGMSAEGFGTAEEDGRSAKVLTETVCDDSSAGGTRCRTEAVSPPKARSAREKSASPAASPLSSPEQPRMRRESASSANATTATTTTSRPPPTTTRSAKPKIRWRDSGLTGISRTFHNPIRSHVPPSPLGPGVVRSTLAPEVQQRIEAERFYRNYNPMEGVVTAVVLGGFFAFVCLLVVYKTKCKPMWKNRRRRLHNTPATRSVADNDMGKGELGVVGDLATDVDLAEGIGDELPGVMVDDEPIECCEGDYDYDEDEEDYLDEEYEYECIPLRSVFGGADDGSGVGEVAVAGEGDEESDVYFLDEFGNYVFPIMAPSMPGSCLCHPHEEPDEGMNVAYKRRQSQGSAISNAYTVKSLPGAYLYIPLLASAAGAGGSRVHNSEAIGAGAGGSVVSVSSLASVRRSLSDPEIHFAPPFGHPIIFTVNPSSDNTLGNNNSMVPIHGLHPQSQQRGRQRQKLQQRSHSMQPDTSDSRATTEFNRAIMRRGDHSANNNTDSAADDDAGIEGIIAIQIIQPTPNISPTCSLKSVDDEDDGAGATGESQPLLTASPTSSLKRRKPRHNNKVDRRVSFSDDSVDQEDGQCDPSAAAIPRHSSPSHRAIVQQQMQTAGAAGGAAIPFMNYLQVPGQQPQFQFVAPQLTQEARQAQTSPQARRRRATRLMKAGSFCSITSDGDGDLFGPTGELLSSPANVKPAKRPSLTPSQASKQSSADSNTSTSGNTTQKSTFDLSDYTELQYDDCRSDISDLFAKVDDEDEEEDSGGNFEVKGELKNQGTLSEPGSIKSLSTDEDDKEVTVMTVEEAEDHTEPTIVVPSTTGAIPKHNPPYNNPEYDAIMRHHATTSTMTVMSGERIEDEEEMYASSSCSLSIGSENADRQGKAQDHRITVPVTIEHPPPEMRSQVGGGSGSGDDRSISASLRVEPGSSHRLDEIAMLTTPPSEFIDQGAADVAEGGPPAQPPAPLLLSGGDPEDEVVRLVLVRDIGVQVCGDSPNLNSTRRFPHHRIAVAPRPITATSDVYPSAPPPLTLPPTASPSSSPGPVSAPASMVAPPSSTASLTEAARTRRHHRSAGSSERDDKSEESFPTEILF